MPPALGLCPSTAAAASSWHLLGLLFGLRDDRREILLQGVGIDFLEFLAGLIDLARQFRSADQRQDRVPGTDRIVVEFERTDGPPLLQHLQHRLADGRIARAPRFQLVEAAGEFRREAGLVDTEMLRDESEIRPAGIQQLHQEMLDLDVIVGAGQTKAGRSFQRVTGCRV